MSINPSQNCLVKKVFPMKFLSARCNKIASQLQLYSWFTLGKSRKQIFIFVNRRTMNHNVKHLHFSKIVMYLVAYTKSEVCLILSLCFLFLVRLISVDAMCHQQIASNSGPWSFTPSMVSVCQRIPSGEPFTKSTKFI